MAGTGRINVISASPVGHNQYDFTVQFDIAFDWGGYNLDGAYYEVNVDGQVQSGSATFQVPSGGGSWVWTPISGNKTFRITMPESGKSYTVWYSAYVDTGITPKYIETSGSYTLPARTWKWTVSYNANGGSGAPGAQTKTYGQNLTLSTAKPTRTGYTFQGWATSSGGAVTYQPGATYTGNAALTLYAVWKIITYTVSYNANGGSGAPAAQTKTYGTTLKLSTTVPTRTNYNFKGWGTSAGSTTVAYAAGANYTKNSGITLYAIWQLAYARPRITKLTADRCDSAGALSEEGTYAKVAFTWATDRTVSGISIVCNSVTTNVTATGTSGTVSTVVGAGALSTENEYTITVKVQDSGGSTTTSSRIATLAYVMDVLAEGKGVAFGKVAKYANTLEIAYETLHNTHIKVANNKGLYWYDSTGTLRLLATMGPSDITYFGLDSYKNNFSTVYYCGNEVRVISKTNIMVNAPIKQSNGNAIMNVSDFRTGMTRMSSGWVGFYTDSNQGTRIGWIGNNQSATDITLRLEQSGKFLVSDSKTGSSGQVRPWNKVLWTGVWYVNAAQTVTLSEAVSAQPTGILLQFSYFNPSTNEASDAYYNYTFVPKDHIPAPGSSISCFQVLGTGNLVGIKYLIVNDTTIKGNDDNQTDDTAERAGTGIRLRNSYFVLRRVIGV